MNISKPFYFIIPILLAFLFSQCNKEEIFISGNLEEVTFSVDTLLFDTVFTELGSATYHFKIRNQSNAPILLDEVRLRAGAQSKFRINVDGVAGNIVKDIEILAKDSIYVFAEVTIDPDQPLSISPFIIEEYLEVKSGSASKEILFQAWGQNANYFPYKGASGQFNQLPCDGSVVIWDDPKPYVVYGILWIIDCNLVIPEGAQIYVHGGITKNDQLGIFNDGIILVDPTGRITVEGTPEHPVVFQGDRLEPSFEEAAGQWWGIYLAGGSKGNKFSYATIKNSNIGIYADSASVLTVANSKIRNTLGNAIFGQYANIRVDNTLIHSNYSTSVFLTGGGDYIFNYCTIASYGVDADALNLSNYFCSDGDNFVCNEYFVAPLKAAFTNTIIAGSRKDEIVLRDFSNRENESMFDVQFDHCAVKVTELPSENEGLFQDFFGTLCQSCIVLDLDTPLFENIDESNYKLDSASVARNAGVPINDFISINLDIEGNIRDSSNPNIGCYED